MLLRMFSQDEIDRSWVNRWRDCSVIVSLPQNTVKLFVPWCMASCSLPVPKRSNIRRTSNGCRALNMSNRCWLSKRNGSNMEYDNFGFSASGFDSGRFSEYCSFRFHVSFSNEANSPLLSKTFNLSANDPKKSGSKCPSLSWNGRVTFGLKNNEKLLKSLENESNRKAHYTCVIVFVKHEFDPEPIVVEGTWHGEILKSPRGDGGFGYDPLFLDHMTGKAVAELPSDVKNRISHRGQALHKLKLKLNQIYG